MLTTFLVRCLLLVLGLWCTSSACAQVNVTIDHNETGAAGFHFKTVTVPRRSAALAARFILVDGAPDPNGGTLDALNDADLPSAEDEPEANFFFSGDGGRVLVDLGKILPVKEVDTYSWHPDIRAPQVYKLYGSDGGSADFDPRPKRPRDPARTGWKLLVSVDTRGRFGMKGGQYGVSVTDAALLGRCRYLLFDVSCTDADDPNGNTFFSEIAVIEASAPAEAIKPVVAETVTRTYDENALQVTFTSDDPKFDPGVRDALVKAFFTSYPKMMKEFNPDAARNVKISFERKYHGVAATAGTTIHVNPQWFHDYPKDIDVITHEGMHVVQAYKQGEPGWLREGLADYARYKFGVDNAGAGWTLPDYSPEQNYTDAYRVTARFLVWLEKHVKPGVAVAMDRAMRDGRYTADSWKQLTGRSVEELWRDYGRNPAL